MREAFALGCHWGGRHPLPTVLLQERREGVGVRQELPSAQRLLEHAGEGVGDRLMMRRGNHELDHMRRGRLEHGVAPTDDRAGVCPDLLIDLVAERLVEELAAACGLTPTPRRV